MRRMTIRSKRTKLLAIAVHVIRVGVVCALLLLIPTSRPRSWSDVTSSPEFSFDQSPIANVARVAEDVDAAGMWALMDSDGKQVGKLARTLPEAKAAIGYRGPSEASVVFDNALNIVSVRLVDSSDTQEHVDAVVKDNAFFEQFRGWKWGGPSAGTNIDGVSGATLTSLALAKGVMLRIGGDRPSLVFPDAIAESELRPWVTDALTLDQGNHQALTRDEKGTVTGRIIRTGPFSDDLSGYQGPTELLVWLSPDDTVIDLRIRKSFDNEPYVNYIRMERSFWKIFKGKTIQELAKFDPVAAGVEGVSGATMTSVIVADTVVAAAKAAIVRASQTDAPEPEWWQAMQWSFGEISAVVALLSLLVFSKVGAFRHRFWRTAWLVGIVLVVGLGTGNLISLALVAGWSAEGIAWKLAPGLFAIVVVAFLTPSTTKGNPYCSHLCPHGALQQLIRSPTRSRRHLKLPAKLSQWLVVIPGATLVVAYLFLLFRPATDLSSWEPFHAYLFRIAGWGSIAFALGSLAVSTFIPMAYCRLGCPTGRLLEHLRRSAASDRIKLADCVAFALLGVASWVRWG